MVSQPDKSSLHGIDQQACVFCKIIDRALPAEIVFEDQYSIAFMDLNPKAAIHCLLVPKQHIGNLGTIDDDITHADLLGHMLLQSLPKVRGALGITDFRITMNNGIRGGQVIFHMHWHLLSEQGCRLHKG